MTGQQTSQVVAACCVGTSPSTPRQIDNRPGLSAISYRSGEHGDFLASMLAALSSETRPALGGLQTRDGDDPTIAVLDAWAVACDVLTFYSERLATESFLRTATERTSLQELGKLVAYRLFPGVGAETYLAFSLERPPPVPAQLPPDPGLLPPVVPAAVTLPIALRVQSTPGPGQLPQTFETVEEIESRAEWNALPVAGGKFYPPIFGRRDAWLAGTSLNLKPGEAVLFASDDLVHDRWDVRVLTAVDTPEDGRTHIRWDRGLGSFIPPNQPADAPATFVLRKRISVFGHNAPTWTAMNTEFQTGYKLTYPAGSNDTEWPQFTATTVSAGVTTVDLDGSHPDIARGSWVVVSQETAGFHRELYRVVGASELSRSEFAVSGKVTRLQLEGEVHDFGTPREVTVIGGAEPLELTEAPDASAVVGTTVVVDGDATQMVEGRTLLLAGRATTGEEQAEVVRVRSVAPIAGGRTSVVLEDSIGATYDRATAVVFGNVARATHGETVVQILGDGDGRRRFQRFPLRHAPLTYVQADTPRGAASTLRVHVAGVEWRERLTLFGAGPADRVLVTRAEPDGTVVVAFGDGMHGGRLPSGSHNVRATYRKGLGAAGNVDRHALSQAVDRPLGLKAVTNPLSATGGVDPENESDARASIPLVVKTLGRAVSLQDYADFALAFAGVSLASAAALNLREGPSIVVTIAGRGGLPAPTPTATRLAGELRRQGDPHVRVVVLPARVATFRMALKVAVDPDRQRDAVFAAVEQALRATYGAAHRALGRPVHRSAVIATAAAVPGVVAVDLDRLYRGSLPGLAERLVAEPVGVTSAGTAIAAELLSLSPEPFDWLEEMP